ncbi:MAG: hypothetical protein NC548_62985 [Lachnospiraceae bacterium]|nr:hypothetical protein [Lachnospiraceae bacterium]MCM1237273.1 hypothetical protein [Ruminococcus flavefaciens]
MGISFFPYSNGLKKQMFDDSTTEIHQKTNKIQNIIVKITFDNSEFLKSLDEVIEKLELIQEKMKDSL